MLTFFGQAALGNQIPLTSAVEQLLVEWSEETDRPFSISRGESHWFQEMDSPKLQMDLWSNLHNRGKG